jgi:ABC-2 type transport system permease protein
MLDEGKTRAVVVLNRGGAGINSADVIRDVTEPSVGKRFEQELPNIFIKYSKDLSVKRISEFLAQHNNLTPQAANENAEKAVAQCDITFTTNAWQELKFFDYFASSSIVLIALCLSLFLSAIAITEERSIGTLERVFATPYQKSEIIIGRMLAYNILAVVMAVLIIITLKVVFDATLGNIWLILLLTFLVAVNGVIFGLLISSITSSETESLLLAMLFILLFILQMTYLWPWETMHPVARFVSYVMPYTYGYQAICRVNMLGAGFADVWLDLVILVGFILVQAVIATLVLRREIK